MSEKYGATFTNSDTIKKALDLLCEKEGIDYDGKK
jgi:hypothetical protein